MADVRVFFQKRNERLVAVNRFRLKRFVGIIGRNLNMRAETNNFRPYLTLEAHNYCDCYDHDG